MDRSPSAAPPPLATPEVSVIIPARNEEAAIADCLQSLTAQTGVAFEIILVDDASTDRTSEIARGFSGVRVLSAAPLSEHSTIKHTGKNNALISGVRAARAAWLLFTDADTVHLPGSLSSALDEARNHHADLLSYSPEQVVVTFAERAVMPVIFAELAAQYPPHKVRNQNSETVAANGQYILVCRAAYDAVGGHAAVAAEIVEDVALARLFRHTSRPIFFRYGGDAVRTRMYRNWQQLREGWTKNLALLFLHPEYLALQSVSLWLAAWLTLALGVVRARQHLGWMALAILWLMLYRRIRAANFAPINNLIAIAFGPPLFAYLLLRSRKAHAQGQVSWKGRTYSTSPPCASKGTDVSPTDPMANIRNQNLRTEN